MHNSPSFTIHLAAQAALKDMVRRGRMDICCIREVISLTGAIPDGQALKTLALLHCVEFSSMPRELLERLPALISACLNGPVLDISVVLKVPERPSVITILTSSTSSAPEREPERPRRLWGLLGSTKP